MQALVEQAEPALSPTLWNWRLIDEGVDQALLKSLGAYGRLLTPPHLLAAGIAPGPLALIELGFRLEQVAVGLATRQIGSCFVGLLGNEERAAEALGLPPDGRIGAALALGYPPTRGIDRALNSVVHGAIGASARLPLHNLVLDESWRPTQPPADLVPLLTAGQRAPSAVNAQPWRWAIRGGALWLLVRRHNPRYGSGAKQDYRLFDAGACLANLSLAGRALGRPLVWRPLDSAACDAPSELEAVASASLG